MSDNIDDKILPATLQEGEAVIPKETAEKFQEFIDEIKKPRATEVTAEAFGIESVVAAAATETENLITAKSKSKNGPISQVLGAVKNGTIGTTTKESAEDSAKRISQPSSKSQEEKVAVYSTKSVRWGSVGEISRGYNIFPKSVAEKWLTRYHVRLATNLEIEREFGK